MDFLVFRLYGPMASWGATAVGGVRPSHPLPTRSAMLGLLSAALGIRRHQQDDLDTLSGSLDIAVRSPGRGILIRDYHTSQVPSVDKKAVWSHRKAELENSRKGLNTILSTRDYWADNVWIIALSSRPGATISLDAIEEALAKPRFPLFLGRKSCPLAAPLAPRRVEAEGLKQALYTNWSPLTAEGNFEAKWNRESEIHWESEDTTLVATETFEQWDQPGSRKRWQFEKRTVYVTRLGREG